MGSREDLEDHRSRRHKEYNCDQCDNWYRTKEDLEDHRNETHSKKCEENLECWKEREQQNKEKHRSEHVCDLCNEEFNNGSELKEHWVRDHKIHVYEFIHLECEEKYIFEELWREHMKEKHKIGFYCEHCNEYIHIHESY